MWISKTTGDQTAEDSDTISQGTHFRKHVLAAKGDVELHNQFEKEVVFYTFCIRAGCFNIGKCVIVLYG